MDNATLFSNFKNFLWVRYPHPPSYRVVKHLVGKMERYLEEVELKDADLEDPEVLGGFLESNYISGNKPDGHWKQTSQGRQTAALIKQLLEFKRQGGIMVDDQKSPEEAGSQNLGVPIAPDQEQAQGDAIDDFDGLEDQGEVNGGDNGGGVASEFSKEKEELTASVKSEVESDPEVSLIQSPSSLASPLVSPAMKEKEEREEKERKCKKEYNMRYALKKKQEQAQISTSVVPITPQVTQAPRGGKVIPKAVTAKGIRNIMPDEDMIRIYKRTDDGKLEKVGRDYTVKEVMMSGDIPAFVGDYLFPKHKHGRYEVAIKNKNEDQEIYWGKVDFAIPPAEEQQALDIKPGTSSEVIEHLKIIENQRDAAVKEADKHATKREEYLDKIAELSNKIGEGKSGGTGGVAIARDMIVMEMTKDLIRESRESKIGEEKEGLVLDKVGEMITGLERKVNSFIQGKPQSQTVQNPAGSFLTEMMQVNQIKTMMRQWEDDEKKYRRKIEQEEQEEEQRRQSEFQSQIPVRQEVITPSVQPRSQLDDFASMLRVMKEVFPAPVQVVPQVQPDLDRITTRDMISILESHGKELREVENSSRAMVERMTLATNAHTSAMVEKLANMQKESNTQIAASIERMDTRFDERMLKLESDKPKSTGVFGDLKEMAESIKAVRELNSVLGGNGANEGWLKTLMKDGPELINSVTNLLSTTSTLPKRQITVGGVKPIQTQPQTQPQQHRNGQQPKKPAPQPVNQPQVQPQSAQPTQPVQPEEVSPITSQPSNESAQPVQPQQEQPQVAVSPSDQAKREEILGSFAERLIERGINGESDLEILNAFVYLITAAKDIPEFTPLITGFTKADREIVHGYIESYLGKITNGGATAEIIDKVTNIVEENKETLLAYAVM